MTKIIDHLNSITQPWHIAVEPRELEPFTLPITTAEEEHRLLEQLYLEYTNRYSVGLVIGRFQPLHYGHLFLMKQALQVSTCIVIGIGSSNIKNVDNPFSPEQREKMLLQSFEREREIKSRVISIVRLDDYFNDNLWISEALKKTGDVDVIVGNNEWVNGIFENANYPVVRTTLYHRTYYEGRKIREKLRNARK